MPNGRPVSREEFLDFLRGQRQMKEIRPKRKRFVFRPQPVGQPELLPEQQRPEQRRLEPLPIKPQPIKRARPISPFDRVMQERRKRRLGGF